MVSMDKCGNISILPVVFVSLKMTRYERENFRYLSVKYFSCQAIVTDFNNHRLLVIKSNFCSAQVFFIIKQNISSHQLIFSQFLGCEGTKDGEFTRPNGVTVDDEGNIIVADSRNHRIQVSLDSRYIRLMTDHK